MTARAIIVCGSPGAGKSTYGRRLAQDLGAAFFDIDTCTEPLVRMALAETGRDPDDRDSRYFKDTFRLPIYNTLFAAARENLSHLDVVIVGPFTKELRDSGWPDKLRRELCAEVEVHYVRCDPQLRRTRLQERANRRDQAKLSAWDDSRAYYGDEEPPVFPHVLVESGSGDEENESG